MYVFLENSGTCMYFWRIHGTCMHFWRILVHVCIFGEFLYMYVFMENSCTCMYGWKILVHVCIFGKFRYIMNVSKNSSIWMNYYKAKPFKNNLYLKKNNVVISLENRELSDCLDRGGLTVTQQLKTATFQFS